MLVAKKEIPFRTAYSAWIKHTTPSGEGIIEEYNYEYTKDNRKELVKTGETDLYKQIQSHHESTKIENILARVAVGDMSDFRANGIFADTTGLPTNLIDAQKNIQKVENFWDMQPREIKEKYKNDVNLFMADIGNESWLINTGLLNPTADEPTPAVITPETTV